MTACNVCHTGYIPGAGIPLQKQLEHANQQSGFTDAVRIFDIQFIVMINFESFQDNESLIPDICTVWTFSQGALRPMHPPAMHPSAPGLLPTPSMAVQIPTAKVSLQNTHCTSKRIMASSVSDFIVLFCVSRRQSPFQSSPQGAPRHGFLPHSQSGQRFYHHGK